MALAKSSCHQPSQTREGQKSLQCTCEVPWCSPQRQTSIGTRLVAEFDSNHFRFRQHQIALSVDIESMFLQVAVPSGDNRCLQFLWRENTEQKIEVCEYTPYVFGAKSCANYILHQQANDNAINDERLVRTVLRNFYMDHFLKSVKTPQEAIEIYQTV